MDAWIMNTKYGISFQYKYGILSKHTCPSHSIGLSTYWSKGLQKIASPCQFRSPHFAQLFRQIPYFFGWQVRKKEKKKETVGIEVPDD